MPDDLEVLHMKLSGEAPMRLCCMQRHYGLRCPDGKVMCCLCFDRFDPDDLAVDPEDGCRWDMCKPCYEADQAALRARG